MNESTVKYLAGLLDADGSLSFSFASVRNKPGRCYVGLAMKLSASDAIDKGGFVESLPEKTGMGSSCRSGERRQYAVWTVCKRADLEMLLPRLVKHMVIKAGHWQWLLEVWREVRRKSKTCSLEERDLLTAASRESRKLRVGPLKPKNHPTWAWLAGYLDGDGWYLYRSGRYKSHKGREYRQWTIEVGAAAHENDANVLTFLQKAFGGIVKNHSQSDNVKVWKRSLGYQNRAFALRFLPNVAKHSQLKRQKIDAIIHHHRQRLSVPGTERRFCEMDGCNRPRHGNGLCSMHYQRQRKTVQATV